MLGPKKPHKANNWLAPHVVSMLMGILLQHGRLPQKEVHDQCEMAEPSFAHVPSTHAMVLGDATFTHRALHTSLAIACQSRCCRRG